MARLKTQPSQQFLRSDIGFDGRGKGSKGLGKAKTARRHRYECILNFKMSRSVDDLAIARSSVTTSKALQKAISADWHGEAVSSALRQLSTQK